MNIEQSTLDDCLKRCERVVNLIHAAHQTVKHSSVYESDETATAEVLGIVSKDADDLYGVILEAKELAKKPAAKLDLKIDWDERVVVVHKGQVLVTSGALEDHIKHEVARATELAT